MSAMSDMSRAILEQIERTSPIGTLQGLSLDVLEQYVQIVGAFYADLRDEYDSRISGAPARTQEATT